MYVYNGKSWREAKGGVVPPDPVQVNWSASVEYRGCMLLIGGQSSAWPWHSHSLRVTMFRRIWWQQCCCSAIYLFCETAECCGVVRDHLGVNDQFKPVGSVKGMPLAALDPTHNASSGCQWQEVMRLPQPRCAASAAIASGLRSIPVGFPAVMAARQRLALATGVFAIQASLKALRSAAPARTDAATGAKTRGGALARLAGWWQSSDKNELWMLRQIATALGSVRPPFPP